MTTLKPYPGRTTTYYKPQRTGRVLTYLEVAKAAGEAGWNGTPQETHATAVATFRAESAFYTEACLCYLLIPGSPGLPERWAKDAKRYATQTRVPLPIPNYLLPWKEKDATAWQRRIYWRTVEQVRLIPAQKPAAPGYHDLQAALDEMLIQKEIRARVTFEQTSLKQDRIDYGLCQLNSQYIRINFDYRKNLETAYAMYCRRGFSPWVAWSNGNYKAFMPDARAAVKKVRG